MFAQLQNVSLKRFFKRYYNSQCIRKLFLYRDDRSWVVYVSNVYLYVYLYAINTEYFSCLGTLLRGKSFYSMDNKPFCEQCYVVSIITHNLTPINPLPLKKGKEARVNVKMKRIQVLD